MKDQGDWLKQAGEWQQRYWDGWRDLAGQAMGQVGRPPNTPWQDGLDAWQRALGAGIPGASAAPRHDDVANRLLAHGKQYLDLLQGLMGGQGFAAGAGQAFDPRAWIDEMRTLHERYGQGAMLSGQGAFPWFGGIDPAQVEQMVKAFASAPMRGVQQEWQSWLGVPAFGLAREHQERGQALLRAWLDYQAANARYNDLMLKTTAKTFDVLESKLAEREDPGRQITTARALYDVWIDAAEDAFAGIAMSPEYRAIYGELVNTQMRVRAGLNDEIERFGAQFGMPTRTEVDSLACQVHDLKRELRRLSAGKAASNADANRVAPAEARRASSTGSRPQPARRAVAESAKGDPKIRKSKASKKSPKPASRSSAKGAPSIQSTALKRAKGG